MDQWLLCRSCRGKILSCSTTLATGCTYKSRGIVVGSVQAVAAIANDESLQVRVRKAHPPPEGRSSLHPSAHKGARTGCALTLRNAASLQKHCPVACKARVKQVRPWTYPSKTLLIIIQIAPFPAKESGLTMYDNAVLGCGTCDFDCRFRVSRLPGNFKVVTPAGRRNAPVPSSPAPPAAGS